MITMLENKHQQQQNVEERGIPSFLCLLNLGSISTIGISAPLSDISFTYFALGERLSTILLYITVKSENKFKTNQIFMHLN
jgi:hypothetical protein